MSEVESQGWAMFRLIDGEMRRVSSVGSLEWAVRLRQFDECIASYMKADGADPNDFYIRPVDMEPGSAYRRWPPAE